MKKIILIGFMSAALIVASVFATRVQAGGGGIFLTSQSLTCSSTSVAGFNPSAYTGIVVHNNDTSTDLINSFTNGTPFVTTAGDFSFSETVAFATQPDNSNITVTVYETSSSESGSSMTTTATFTANCSAPTPTPTTTVAPTSAPAQSSNNTPGPGPVTQRNDAPTCGNIKPGTIPDLFQINANNTSATLYFTPNNDHQGYYYVAYGLTPGSEQYGVRYDMGNYNGVVSYQINSLAPNTTYWFKVRAGNGCMPGDWSNWLMAKTNSNGVVSYYQYK